MIGEQPEILLEVPVLCPVERASLSKPRERVVGDVVKARLFVSEAVQAAQGLILEEKDQSPLIIDTRRIGQSFSLIYGKGAKKRDDDEENSRKQHFNLALKKSDKDFFPAFAKMRSQFFTLLSPSVRSGSKERQILTKRVERDDKGAKR